MTHEELNLQKSSYLLDNSVKFRIDLSKMYSDLTREIRKRKGSSEIVELSHIIQFIWENLDQIKYLSMEDRYMVINCVRLARSLNYKSAINLDKTPEYQELEESYANLR